MSLYYIYLLYHKDNKDINYVGSTKNVKNRFSNHQFIDKFKEGNIISEILDKNFVKQKKKLINLNNHI